MARALRFTVQVVAYLCFALIIGYFSSAPDYTHLDPTKALIKLSFRHVTQHKVECRRLSQAELAELAPNMRRPLDCPRERSPMLVVLSLNGEDLYEAVAKPSGLGRDGASTVYARFAVAPGRYAIGARLRDTNRSQGFDYEFSKEIELVAGQNFAIDFKAETGGFKIL